MLKRAALPHALWRPVALPRPAALRVRLSSGSTTPPAPARSNATLLSRFYAPTERSTEVETPLTLLQRGGYVRVSASGVYSLLPAGLRVQRKIADIVARHMRAAGASQMQLPTLLPAALWKKSGRWDGMGRELYRLQDRSNKDWLLAPTHEEEVTALVAEFAQSAKRLPVRLFQITRKHRDEPRPRGGLVRTREFLMKDMYTFDADEAGASKTYDEIRQAYAAAFDEILGPGTWRAAEADTGAMGGQRSHEYQVDDPSGEDTILSCKDCGYAANEELAVALPTRTNPPMAADEVEVRLYGPTSLLPGATMTAFVSAKSRRLNDVKLQRHLSGDMRPLSSAGEEAWEWADRPEGPLPSFEKLHVVLDHECRGLEADEVGEALRAAALQYGSPPGTPAEALQDGPTLQELFPSQLQLGSDAPLEAVLPLQFTDLRSAEDGDTCASCNHGTLRSTRTVEVGHTFQLGTRYSDALDATFVPAGDGPRVPFQMGCYGIGITRLLGILASQAHQRAVQAGRSGLAWPAGLAPFRALVLLAIDADEAMLSTAHQLASLLEQGITLADGSRVRVAPEDVAIDDRDRRRVNKRQDADLLGYPLVFILGKQWQTKGEIEVRLRAPADGSGQEQTVFVTMDALRQGTGVEQ